jgi:hypothetical protein
MKLAKAVCHPLPQFDFPAGSGIVIEEIQLLLPVNAQQERRSTFLKTARRSVLLPSWRKQEGK